MSLDTMTPYVGRPVVDQDGKIVGVERTSLASLLQIDAYRDEVGTVWTPPTAWAWAQLCKAHRLSSIEAEKLLDRYGKSHIKSADPQGSAQTHPEVSTSEARGRG